MKNKIIFSDKSQEVDWIIGFIMSRHIYVENFLEQVIVRYTVGNEEKRRNIFEELFVEGKTFGYKLKIFAKLNKMKLFEKNLEYLYKEIYELNDIRNAIAHNITTFPLDEDKSPDLSKPFVTHKGKEFYLNKELLEKYQNLAKKINQELMNLINESLAKI